MFRNFAVAMMLVLAISVPAEGAIPVWVKNIRGFEDVADSLLMRKDLIGLKVRKYVFVERAFLNDDSTAAKVLFETGEKFILLSVYPDKSLMVLEGKSGIVKDFMKRKKAHEFLNALRDSIYSNSLRSWFRELERDLGERLLENEVSVGLGVTVGVALPAKKQQFGGSFHVLRGGLVGAVVYKRLHPSTNAVGGEVGYSLGRKWFVQPFAMVAMVKAGVWPADNDILPEPPPHPGEIIVKIIFIPKQEWAVAPALGAEFGRVFGRQRVAVRAELLHRKFNATKAGRTAITAGIKLTTDF